MRLSSLIYILFLLAFNARAAETEAAKPSVCEASLVSAFESAPNDARINGWQGLVTDKVPITVANLIAGYGRGLFVFADDDNEKMGRWYNPPTRGILRMDKVHFGSRNERWIRSKLRSGELRVTHDQAFERVIRACAELPREGGWITETHIQEFTKLFHAGYAHSVEVWKGEELVGGLYLVFVNGMASGESMFQLIPNGMRVAYYALVERLKANGHELMDTQMNHGLTQHIGGEDRPRFEYKRDLKRAQEANRPY